MSSKTLKAIAAMVCITALEITNLIMKGPNSTMLAAAVAVVAGLGGYIVGKKTD